MKSAMIRLALITFIICQICVTDYLGLARTSHTNPIQNLPYGIIIGNYSVVVYKIDRTIQYYGGNQTNIWFIVRKLNHSIKNFPFTGVMVIDDHDNSYSTFPVVGIFSRDFERFLAKAPIGLTFSFYVPVVMPETVPLDRLVKAQFWAGAAFKKVLLRTVNISNISQRDIDIESQLNWERLQQAQFIAKGEKIRQGKFLSWTISEFYDEQMPNNSGQQRVFEFIFENSDYVTRTISLGVFILLDNGLIMPYADAFIDQRFASGHSDTQSLFGEQFSFQVEGLAKSHIVRYNFPTSYGNIFLHPIRIFVLNKNNSKDKTFREDVFIMEFAN